MCTSIPASKASERSIFASHTWLCHSVKVLFPYRTGFTETLKSFFIDNRIEEDSTDYTDTDF